MRSRSLDKQVSIPVGDISLIGSLSMPADASGLVIVVQTTRRPPHGLPDLPQLARLDLSLLTPEEQTRDLWTHKLRFDVTFLGRRLVMALSWLAAQKALRSLKIGLFGMQADAAAALVAAARCPEWVSALVSYSGRLELAMDVLSAVRAPTLLIVDHADSTSLPSNQLAFTYLRPPKRLDIVPAAFYAAEAALLIRGWFQTHLSPAERTASVANSV